ncbi:adenine specific DNA methylase [Chryseobacterium shigense]|uniref:site-specific DNA-methyltransferase (adenine-specific) n=1 Tax=Chryseobacterium shigense TaxID=297244 RepID=A0A1N7I658_9FLAO|nr:site-specific DNA-methyltransferase [Chryseobacterium shigense]PQA95263.1 adenine specific DNA methylase [Chryseobacterium shigense]SIS32532.1 adenine-specific DNA-methyltransferase [Chryseobacterium shigense]
MKLYQTLENQIKKEPNYVSDNGEVKKWVVLNKAQNFDEELIGLLLDDSDLKEKFFIKVKDVLVFKQNLFIQFLEQKNYLNDSYTQFKNKVGLSIDGQYLKQRNEVALVWPFKDCVLEGGQSREEDKREEIFFNETLAQDEITELLDPKVFTNAKVFDKDGEKSFDQLNRNEKGTITDNLIIKGNNLLALHSLKKEFAGKVKLIYIDPPYNTDGDSFQYNDSFNHSTWLTFMKNRLIVAKELLHKSGCLFIHIDYIEFAYLKVLCDEVFGVENFVQIISVKTATPAGFKVVNPGPVNVTEFILMYTKNKKDYKFKKGYVEAPYQKDYKYYIVNREDEYSSWIISDVKSKALELLNVENEKKLKDEYGNEIASIILEKKIEQFVMDNPSIVFATYGPHKPAGILKELIQESKSRPDDIIYHEREGASPFILKAGRLLAFYDKKLQEIDGKLVSTQLLTDFWSDLSWDTLSFEGGVDFKNGKKPEKFLKRIIEVYSNEGDLILDYHLGSGSTCAVAHKLGRKYIGIEQLDYGKNDSVVRLKNVVNGEQGGISKSINWQGGGSFVYLELKKYNQIFVEKIEDAQDAESLLKIWEEMKTKSFLNYNIDIKKQEQYLEDFKALHLKEQKQHLCELLNKNQLYVNLSSLNDGNFECTPEEKKVTKDFYQIKH